MPAGLSAEARQYKHFLSAQRGFFVRDGPGDRGFDERSARIFIRG